MAVMQNESEVAVHAAQSLSRELQGAYRDIHDLVLARSSSGKLARLLLSCAPRDVEEWDEQRLHSVMTHEEMAQRIGSSRETVRRLLSHLKKKESDPAGRSDARDSRSDRVGGSGGLTLSRRRTVRAGL